MTLAGRCEHPNQMLLARRIGAIALALFISGGDAALCAGWEVTAEARMACCVSGACPMHGAGEHGSGSANNVSQAEADSCCLASESTGPTPTSQVFAMVLPSAVPVPQLFAFVSALIVMADAAREPIPLSGSQVPKHLLLSVFLI